MAGNTATLQIKIDVDNKGTVTLDQVSKSLNNVDTAARKASGGLDVADKGMSSTSASSSKAAAGVSSAAKSLDTADSSARKAAGGLGAASSSMDKLASAAAVYLSLSTAGKVIGMADEMSVLSSKVKLATGSVEEHRAVQQQLYAMSQNTRSEIGVNANAFFGYATALNSTGASSKDVLGVIDMVNKSLKVSGATTSEASSFTLQFKQALGSGVVQGDEFRAMVENNVFFARALAEALNTDISGLRAMSSAGELTTNKLATLFPGMAEKINAAFEKIPVTVEGATTQIENAFKMALAGANETTGGTNKLATQISGLAVIVQENAPAIGALFSGAVLGAQGFVRLGSFVVGTFETLAAAATASYGVIFKVGQALEWVTDRIGITDQATKFWAENAEAAFSSAGDLATKAGDNYNRMTRSTADAEKAQKDYLKSLQGGSAAVLADIDAQKKREAEHSGSVQNMSKAEQKAADERTKALDEMHKSIGGEDYYRREADKVLAHVEVLKKAGATQEQQARYTYEKIAELSAQAWKKGETAAGEYLDQVKSTYADAAGVVASADLSVDITADSSQLQAVTAQSKRELDALGSATATADIAADTGQFDSAAESSRAQAAELAATTATVKIDADTSQFDSAMSSAQQSAQSVGGQMAVNMQSAEELKAAIQALDATPTLDPFGETRKQYRQTLDDMEAQATASANKRAATEAAAAREAHEEQLASAQELYDQQVAAAEEAYDKQRKAAEEAAEAELEAKKESLEQQVAAVEEAQKKEQEARSAYAEIYENTGLGAEQAFAGQAEELYEQAQEYKDKGIDTNLVEAQLQVQLTKLRQEAAEAGATGLDQYISMLENSYESTGNFSDSTAAAAEKIEELQARIEELEESGMDEIMSSWSASISGFQEAVRSAAAEVERLKSGSGSGRGRYELVAGTSSQYAWVSYAGGGYTWDGPRSGGVDGLGGRQVLLHPQETVIDHTKPDRAAIVSLYDQFVGQQRGAAAAPSSSPAAAAAGEAPINIGTLIIQRATDVDGIMREIRRRAVRQ